MHDIGESASAIANRIASPASFDVASARAPVMRPVLDLARRAARSAANVLISGETGTGKRSLARWIHDTGARRAGPLIVAGSTAVSEALLAAGRAGGEALLAGAAGGTLVIDELVELSHEAQAALIELLDAPARRPGGPSGPSGPRSETGTRVIATTRHASPGVRLRADLYYAIAVISIAVPPLRERVADLSGLVAGFLARTRRPAAITDAALAWLGAADWPGNVRELEATIERAVALSDDGVIDVAHLAGGGRGAHIARPPSTSIVSPLK